MANNVDGSLDPPRRTIPGLGRVEHLVGAVSNRVLGELDPDIVVAHLDVDALLERVDIEAVLDRIDVDEVLDRVDVDKLLDRVDVDRLLDRVTIDRLLVRADIDGLVERVDVQALADRLDIDPVLASVDIDALLRRVDLDALVARVDLDGALARVDLDELIARVDIDQLIARVDIDQLVARVDVDQLVERVDIDGLMARIDLDVVVARIDVDAIVDRLDIEELVQRAGIPEIVADSTGQLAGSALDLARRQLVAVDIGAWRLSQRLLHRDPTKEAAGPDTLVARADTDVELPDPDKSRVRARAEVSGYYAGPISRLLAFGVDVAFATALFTIGSAAVAWIFETVAGVDLTPATGTSGIWWFLAGVAWLFVYWTSTTIVAGRTPAMMAAGLRITSRDGTPLLPSRALVRTLALPLSVPGFLGGAWMMMDKERRALHDLIAQSAVVYDWGGRPAEMPTPLAHWIDARDEAG
ncbi:MAG TPA: RDD family protein [Nitriliruptoraceae bacterium]|nr:RDD family protein [Nitriliruptoraceae bacterium]